MKRDELLLKIQMALPEPYYPPAVESIFDTIFQTISHALVIGDIIEIPNFGKFSLKARLGRDGFDPRNRAPIKILPRRAICFSPAMLLKAKVNPHLHLKVSDDT